MILHAVIMGLGGGIIRDVLLGLWPVAVTNHYYLPTVTVAALAGYVLASLLRRFGTPFAVLDAVATAERSARRRCGARPVTRPQGPDCAGHSS